MSTNTGESVWDRIAWMSLLALVVATTLAVAKIPFLPDTNPVVERFSGPQYFMLTALTLLSAGAWLIGWIRSGRSIALTYAHMAVAGLMGVALISTLFSAVRPLAFVGESGRYIGFVTWACCAAAFFLASQLVSSRPKLEPITRTFIIIGTIEALVAITQVLGVDVLRFQVPQQFLWMLAQGFGTLGNPNHLASILVLPCVLAYADAVAPRSRPWSIFSALATAVMGVALVASATRGAWVGVVVGLIAFTVIALRHRAVGVPRLIAGLLLAVLIAGLGFGVADNAIIETRFPSVAGSEDAVDLASSGRATLWRQSGVVFAQHPVIGVGPDSVRNAFKSAGLSSGKLGVFTDDPHGLPILLAVTVGAIGLLFAAAVLLLVLWPNLRSAASASQEPSSDLDVTSSWLPATLGLLTTALVSVLSIPMLLALMVALGVLHAHAVANSTLSVTPRTPLRVAIAAVLLLTFSVGFYTALVPLVHNARITATDLTVPLSDTAIRVLDDADQALPWRYEMLSRRTARFIEQAEYEHMSGQDDSGRGASRLQDLRDTLDVRVNRYPGDYYAWQSRVQAYVATARIVGAPGDTDDARSVIAAALERFPNDLELLAIADSLPLQ